MLPMILNIVDMTGGTTNAPYMILNIVDMTGGTTNAPYDPKYCRYDWRDYKCSL